MKNGSRVLNDFQNLTFLASTDQLSCLYGLISKLEEQEQHIKNLTVICKQLTGIVEELAPKKHSLNGPHTTA